jgi:hypothetical protein
VDNPSEKIGHSLNNAILLPALDQSHYWGLYKYYNSVIQNLWGIIMEIKLPPVQAFTDKILAGNITILRIPMAAIETGDVISVKAPGVHPENIRIGIIAVEHPLLHSITIKEAEQEGYTVPDFCPSSNICGNIETRLDFESLLFDQKGDIPTSRSREDFEKELNDRLKAGCSTCLLKKDSKDLFLSYWKKTYNETENEKIVKFSFEIISRK